MGRLLEALEQTAKANKDTLMRICELGSYITDALLGTPGVEHPYRYAWGKRGLGQVLEWRKLGTQSVSTQVQIELGQAVTRQIEVHIAQPPSVEHDDLPIAA